VEVQLSRGGGIGPVDVRWGGIAITVLAALILGGASGAAGRHYLNSRVAPPLPAVTRVQAQPIPTVGPGTEVTPAALPDHILLQVPFTTQAPLNNWDKHQESCEAANLTMLLLYWGHDQSVVIDPHAADSYIKQIDGWKSQPDLNDTMLGQLAEQHYGYSYRILGNPRYPGYANHYEQNGYSVPHFVTIIGYDSTGVWLNDPGISWGRGYHITYAQLAHAIDDLDQHHPALAQGQVLLLIAPEAKSRVRPGTI